MAARTWHTRKSGKPAECKPSPSEYLEKRIKEDTNQRLLTKDDAMNSMIEHLGIVIKLKYYRWCGNVDVVVWFRLDSVGSLPVASAKA